MVSPEGALWLCPWPPPCPSEWLCSVVLACHRRPSPLLAVGTAEADRAPLTSRGQALPTASPVKASDSRPDADVVTRCLPRTDGPTFLASALGLVLPAIPPARSAGSSQMRLSCSEKHFMKTLEQLPAS